MKTKTKFKNIYLFFLIKDFTALILLIITMFSFIVIAFQVVAVIFIGAFARTTSTALISTGYLTSTISLCLAFALMYCPFKKLSYFSLMSVLLTVTIGIQSFLLFGMFWDSCFNGFNTSYQLTTLLLQRGVFCALAILLVWLDFIAILKYWQIYMLIAPIFTLGYTFNSAVIDYGIKAFDGGGGLQIFLYSGVVSAIIWAFIVRGKVKLSEHPNDQSYFSRTLGFIGIVIALIAWPQFNAAGASVSQINTILTASTSLANSAISNTFLGLAVAIVTSMLFTSQGVDDRLKAQVYFSSFINAGIVIASYQDIALNPVSCMLLTFVTTIINLIIYKYLLQKGQNSLAQQTKVMARIYIKILFRIIYSFVGIIITSIVVATRFNSTPQLLSATDFNVYSQKAGLQIAAFFITLVIAIFFGLLIVLAINLYLRFKQRQFGQETKYFVNLFDNKDVALDDQNYFAELYQEIFPIYNESKKQIDDQQLNTTRMMRASLLPTQKKDTHSNHKTMVPDKEKKKEQIKINQKKQEKQRQQQNKKYLEIDDSKHKNYSKGILLMSRNFSKTKDQVSHLSQMKNINEDVQSYESRKPEQQRADEGQHRIHVQDSIVRKSRLEEQIIKQIVDQNKSSTKFIIEEQSQQKVSRKLDYAIVGYKQSQISNFRLPNNQKKLWKSEFRQ